MDVPSFSTHIHLFERLNQKDSRYTGFPTPNEKQKSLSLNHYEQKNDINNVMDGKSIKIRARMEQLKQHQKYKIMEQKNMGLLDEELIALIVYTDSWTECTKMKRAHRKLPMNTTEHEKYKKYYFHLTNGIIKMHQTFHLKNPKNNISKLFHGSTINCLDLLSQEQLFLKTVYSFSAKFGIAKIFGAGSLLVIDNVSEGLASGTLKGANVTWISKYNEEEYIILPTTFYQWRKLEKQEMIQNQWMVQSAIPIYITGKYISNIDPLCVYGDTILKEMEPDYNDLRIVDESDDEIEIREWFDQCVCLKQGYNKKYFNLFIENGYDQMDIIVLMTEQELKEIGIDKKGHVLKIIHEIEKLKGIDINGKV